MTKLDLDWPHNFNEIPKEVFVRKDVYDTELQRIFHGEEWHPVCHESEIPERGDFKTFRLAGIPLLISRGDEDRKSTRLNFSHSCATRMPSSACTNQSTFLHLLLYTH